MKICVIGIIEIIVEDKVYRLANILRGTGNPYPVQPLILPTPSPTLIINVNVA
jgi:hypothetical protein